MRHLVSFSMLVVTASLAPAATIQVFSTGNGSTTDNTVDPHWTYTNSSNTTANALVANNPGVDFWNGGGGLDPWLADNASSSWIVDNTANSQSGGLPLLFQTTFSLSGLNPATASITLEWGADDNANLVLNGNVVASLPGQNFSSHWNQLHSITLSSGFLAGTNTLQVVLTDDNNNFEGARVQIDSATASPSAGAPEPGTYALLGIGALTLGLIRLTRAHPKRHARNEGEQK